MFQNGIMLELGYLGVHHCIPISVVQDIMYVTKLIHNVFDNVMEEIEPLSSFHLWMNQPTSFQHHKQNQLELITFLRKVIS